jgi:hypothetical protein
MASILIATPIYEGHEQFLTGYLESIRDQTVPVDILLASTSDDAAFNERINKIGQEVLFVPAQPTKYQRVIAARNMIIEKFLAGSWTHLFFVDADIFLPVDAAQKLMESEKAIVSGVYLSPLNIQGRAVILPVAYDMAHDPAFRAPIPVAAILSDQIRKVHSVGFGCCMLAREVLENVKLRPYQGGDASEDIFFCIDAREKGYDTFLNTAVWAKHHAWKVGDERNRYLTKEWNVETSTTFKNKP